MGFLIKSAFWLSLVLLVIPFGAAGGNDAEASVGPLEAMHAARQAIGDIGGICERKPDVCETGRAAFRTITVRAREASRLAFELLDETTAVSEATTIEAVIAESAGPAATQADAAVVTGSVPATR